MNEEIEYAEMLEIPVSTVNVVKKKNRRVRGKNAAQSQGAPYLPRQQPRGRPRFFRARSTPR